MAASSEFEFTNEDIKFNQQGVFSPRQKEWVQTNVESLNHYSKATLWVALAFLPIPLCLIGSMLFLNESTRRTVASGSPAAGVVCFLGILFVVLSVIIGIVISRKRKKDILESRLMVAEGRAKLHTTHNPRWGTGYYMILGDTKIGIVWKDKFEEDERYRVYYCKTRDGYDILMSFERLS
jgi:hypothetical protein